MGTLDGKVAFVSGIARGQGRSHALRLASEGADIIGVDICHDIGTMDYPNATPADLAETTKLIEQLDRRAITSEADVRDYDAVAARHRLGRGGSLAASDIVLGLNSRHRPAAAGLRRRPGAAVAGHRSAPT